MRALLLGILSCFFLLSIEQSWSDQKPILEREKKEAELPTAAQESSFSQKALPDLHNGRTLYEEHCGLCHGSTGQADSQAASMLKFKPKAFANPSPEDGMSPQNAFDVITEGKEENQMPSFSFLSEKDRWDIAAYIFTLRVDLPEVEKCNPSLSWAKVKNMSDADVLRKLQHRGVPPEKRKIELSIIRRYPQ
ncbi:MAG: cytochrome c [Bdellovibrionota bacterium]